MSPAPRLIAITSLAHASSEEHLTAYRRAQELLPEGAFAVQLRGPALASSRLLSLGERLRDLLLSRGNRLIVNDRADIALALGVTALHLGSRSISIADARALLGPHAFVSVACHAPREVADAAREGASAALLSPIFASPGKGPPIGLGALVEARRLAPTLALYALGGIDASNVTTCLATGATGVAAIRAALDDALPRSLLNDG